MYSQNVATECRGTDIITDFFRTRTGNHPIKLTDAQQQQLVGDIVVISAGKSTSCELKIEQRYTGNVFIETFSNREWGKLGWLHTCRSQMLVCYYLDADVLIGVSMQALRHWLLNQTNGTYDNYKQLRVGSSQPNDTWGIAVPIDMLRAAQLDGWWEAQPRHELEQRNEQETN